MNGKDACEGSLDKKNTVSCIRKKFISIRESQNKARNFEK